MAVCTPVGRSLQSGLRTAIPSDLRDLSKQTGKLLPTGVQTAIASTHSMNDTVEKALAALEPYKHDTSLEGTMKLVEKYKTGTESDPLAIDVAQLGNLAGLQ